MDYLKRFDSPYVTSVVDPETDEYPNRHHTDIERFRKLMDAAHAAAEEEERALREAEKAAAQLKEDYEKHAAEFTLVQSRRKRRAAARSMASPNSDTTPLTNRFQAIDPRRSIGREETVGPATKEINPIVIRECNLDEDSVAAVLKEKCTQEHRFKLAKNDVYVFTTSQQDYESVVKYLKAEGHYYFSPQIHDAVKKLTLKGLSEHHSQKEVIAQLQRRSFNCLSVVTLKNRTEEDSTRPARMLAFDTHTNLEEVRRLDKILGEDVVWESYNNRRQHKKCIRCERIDEYVPPKCDKCRRGHETAKCQMPDLSARASTFAFRVPGRLTKYPQITLAQTQNF